MRYGSVCSGIEAATMAWHPIGWSPAFFSEIEAFPSAVLSHHYGSNMPGEADASNGVPNHGDMTKFEEWPAHAIDLLVGGTPCQSFSVAGLRQGLADPRGNLMLTYLAIARRYRPRWLVWENVPGVLSSNGGRDFGTFIRGLEECGYHAAWRVLDAQYVRVDGFERAVPQRRRRVFVVGYLGDWRRAAAVLFEPEGMRGDSAPRRQAGKGFAGAASNGFASSGDGFWRDGVGPLRAREQDSHENIIVDAAARCVTAGYAQRLDWETENFVAHTLKGEGFDASEDGTGRGTPIVPVFSHETAATLTRGAESSGKGGYAGRRQEDDINLVAFDTTQVTSKANRSVPKAGDPCHPLAAGAHAPAIAFNPKAGGNKTIGKSYLEDGSTYTLDTDCTSVAIQQQWAVRRLTPKECERLQGFPDDFTNIPWRNKPTAPDGPRYKALGNSMAVNCMRWLGQRIDYVERLFNEEAA